MYTIHKKIIEVYAVRIGGGGNTEIKMSLYATQTLVEKKREGVEHGKGVVNRNVEGILYKIKQTWWAK